MIRYRLLLLTLDAGTIALTVVLGWQLGLGTERFGSAGSYLLFGAAVAAGWVTALQACNGYEIRHLATGPEEAKRVLRASVLAVGFIALVSYVADSPVSRGYVTYVLPIGAVLLLIERAIARTLVGRHRKAGNWQHRIIAVGTVDSVQNLIQVTERAPHAGLKVVGVCVEDADRDALVARDVPVLGGVFDAADQATRHDVDVVAVTGSGLGPTGVRELGWRLEGTGRGLVMAPALTEIAGTRMHVSPVEGLPLVWVEQPRLGRVPRLAKRGCDMVIGGILLAVATPVMLATAAAIKLTSRGPVMFRQSRLGCNGTEFSIMKFRSMYADAEAKRVALLEMNEQDGGGVLFKIRKDPRITPVGRWIRRFSLDELPQLIQVVTGQMSLVGPRPLASEDSTYSGSARRRLLMRPGLTGLWQVSGRSNLSWDDAVRLDLYYVENWSIGLDLSILGRTVFAVFGRRGAY